MTRQPTCGYPLGAPEHVSDVHEVIVDHIGEVVGGKCVGLDYDEIPCDTYTTQHNTSVMLVTLVREKLKSCTYLASFLQNMLFLQVSCKSCKHLAS